MSYHCLADLLDELGRAGELARIGVPVDPSLEVAEITDRVAQSGGSALLFGAVEGHEIPLITNLLGTEARICRALGIRSPQELVERVSELVFPSEPEAWFETIMPGAGRATLRKLPPKVVKSGPCQQVVRLQSDVDLGQLPLLQCRPEESGKTITAGELFTVAPDSGRTVVGRYDLRVLERDRVAICWDPPDEPVRLIAEYRRRETQMPVAIVLGSDPAGLLAAMAPLPLDADVCAFAGLLRGRPRELVKGRSVDLCVPTDAEIVVEGYIEPAEPPVDAGPLGTTGGYYRPSGPAPVMHVTAMTHRANPVYPAMVPGCPPDEACVIRLFLSRVLLPLVKLAVPEMVDYELPAFGGARHWAFVSIRKDYAGQARKAAHAAWGLRQLMFAKLLVIVDEEVNVHEHEQVWSAVAAHVDPARDTFFAEGPPDPLDPAVPPGELSRRIGVDATAKRSGEHPSGGSRPLVMPEEVRRLVTGRWPEYGLRSPPP